MPAKMWMTQRLHRNKAFHLMGYIEPRRGLMPYLAKARRHEAPDEVKSINLIGEGIYVIYKRNACNSESDACIRLTLVGWCTP